MNETKIFKKFGNHYIADKHTFLMGIDIRFTDHLAKRMKNKVVLETCTGGGFSTISIAKYAKLVYSFEIDKNRILDAKQNVIKAEVSDKVIFFNEDVLSILKFSFIEKIDAAFLDPDWAVSGDKHEYKFLNSNTKPPSNILLKKIFEITKNVTLIQPPFINTNEFKDLPPHECEKLFLNNNLELFCLHFGNLASSIGITEYRVQDNF